jgi:hypothetical protein
MTAIRALCGLAAAAALAACGSGGGAAGTAAKSAGTAAGGPAQAKLAAELVKWAFGTDPVERSGHMTGTIDIAVKGPPRFRTPVALTTIARFTDAPGSLASWDQLLGLTAHGLDFGAGMTSAGGKVYLNIGSTAFRLPDDVVALMRASATGAPNGLIKTLGAFGIRPDRWPTGARVVGNEQLDGASVIHVTGPIDAASVIGDAVTFARLPTAIDPAAQAALRRSVTMARGDIYAGASDHLLRKAEMKMTLAVKPADRAAAGGITSATVDVVLGVSELGTPQQITVQSDQQPFANAIQLLDASAFSKRPAGSGGN